MLLSIYLKELKDSFRDRRTLLLTVFLPIFMMSGLVFFYENMVSSGEGETYALAVDSNVSKDVTQIFSGNETIELVKTDDPRKAVEEGEALVAMIVSSDFIQNINEGKQADITLIGDSFSQNSSNLMNAVTNSLTAFEKVVTSERLRAEGTDLSVIQPFTITKQEVSDEEGSMFLLSFLVPLILAISIGVGTAPSAADLFAGEKEKKTMEALLMTPVKRSTLMLSKWLTIASVGVITGLVTLIVLAMEISLFTENLKEAVSFGENVYVIIGISLLLTIVYAVFIASLQMITSILGKTVKEAGSYSAPIMMLAAFPGMIITNVGLNELTFKHFAIPILNLFSQFKELLMGVVDYQHIAITIGSNLVIMVIIFAIGRVLFMKDKWVMN
ncbi:MULTISPECIES: ABC transporter permease [Rossellomorea]|uniref:ABC transporter permease n=1 Tax=Rossellomorea TaxID=2837508 RepID=UPI001CCCAD4A|nr:MULTISPECIES: ABC transporter permease [Rossellomorea]MCA0148358.1 ABC transporter permease [Rossellomorea vietnamensis]UTE75642.1 ABC transporter permease [Rossellomorea sp. KS-H15a]WGG47825.1 ABC transporter permease [Rossellomorea sp. DA94]